MSRRRIAATLIVGILLGFFAGVAAVSLGRDTARRIAPQSVSAAQATATGIATANYGAMQAAVHGAGKTKPQLVPFIRTLRLGSRDDVRAGPGAVTELQRALVKAKVKPRPLVSGAFGVGTEAAVKTFQRSHKLAASGVYGHATHLKMQDASLYDIKARQVLEAIVKSRTQLRFEQRVTSNEAYAWKHRTSMAYSEGASRGFLPALPGFPRATDCSGYATWLFKVSGLPDPSGFNYTIVGYTGTLAQHGVRIPIGAALHPGDLVFYGGGFPYGHVAVVQNGFLRTVSSHGSPGIKVLPFNYRTVSAIRRYY